MTSDKQPRILAELATGGDRPNLKARRTSAGLIPAMSQRIADAGGCGELSREDIQRAGNHFG